MDLKRGAVREQCQVIPIEAGRAEAPSVRAGRFTDYQLDCAVFRQNLHKRIVQLSEPGAVSAFRKEMLRFLEGQHQIIVQDESAVREMLIVVAKVARTSLDQLTPEDFI